MMCTLKVSVATFANNDVFLSYSFGEQRLCNLVKWYKCVYTKNYPEAEI